MADIIYGGPARFEVQWLGDSGNWWHSSWHRQRWVALLKARTLRILGPRRVIDHVEGI